MNRKKKKVLVLCEYCNQDIFKEEEKFMREYFEGSDMDFFSVTSGDKDYIDGKQIFVNCNDDVWHTYTKSKKAFILLKENNIKYDYIFKINTSTFINHILLRHLVDSLPDNDDTVWCSEMYIYIPSIKVKTSSIYGRGNAILIPKDIVEYMIDSDMSEESFNEKYADDNITGFAIKEYYLKKYGKYINHYRQFGQEWFDCHGAQKKWNNKDFSLDHLRKYIAIQVRDYKYRNAEIKKLETLKVIFKEYSFKDEDLEYIMNIRLDEQDIWVHQYSGMRYYRMNTLPANVKGMIGYNQNNETTDIFICTHKDFDDYPNNNAYKIICGEGQLKNNYPLPVIIDKKEENDIYPLEYNYAEGSRMYWLWKNYNFKKYIGLCHYRKYFHFFDIVPNMDEMFKHFDIILPQPLAVGNIMQNYATHHMFYDISLVYSIIIHKFPEYAKSARSVFNSGFLFPCNMFVMKSDDFKDMCGFVFSVLDEFNHVRNFKERKDVTEYVEEHKDLYLKETYPNNSVAYQERIQGYLLERITNVYYHKHYSDKRVKHIRIFETDDKYNLRGKIQENNLN